MTTDISFTGSAPAPILLHSVLRGSGPAHGRIHNPGTLSTSGGRARKGLSRARVHGPAAHRGKCRGATEDLTPRHVRDCTGRAVQTILTGCGNGLLPGAYTWSKVLSNVGGCRSSVGRYKRTRAEASKRRHCLRSRRVKRHLEREESVRMQGQAVLKPWKRTLVSVTAVLPRWAQSPTGGPSFRCRLPVVKYNGPWRGELPTHPRQCLARRRTSVAARAESAEQDQLRYDTNTATALESDR